MEYYADTSIMNSYILAKSAWNPYKIISEIDKYDNITIVNMYLSDLILNLLDRYIIFFIERMQC